MTACVELDRNRSLPTRPSSKGAGSRLSINAILPASQPAFICAGCKGRGLGLISSHAVRTYERGALAAPNQLGGRSASAVSNRLALMVRTSRGVVCRWGRQFLTLAFRSVATDGQERTQDCGCRASSSWITTAAVDGLPCASRGVSRWSRCALLGRVAARQLDSSRPPRRAAASPDRTGRPEACLRLEQPADKAAPSRPE